MILKTPNLIGDTLDSTAAKLIAYICTTIPVLYQFATYLFKKETFNLTSFIVPVISSVFLLLIFQMCFYMYKASKEIYTAYEAISISNNKLQQELALSRLFNLSIYEKTNNLSSIMTVDRDKIIRETKESFLSKASNHFKQQLRQPEIENMVNEYFDYNINNNTIL